jgi:hypothetical protein
MDINFYYLDNIKEHNTLKTDIGRIIDYFIPASTKLGCTFYNKHKDRYELNCEIDYNSVNALIIKVDFFKSARTYIKGIWEDNIPYSSISFLQSNTCRNTVKYFQEKGFLIIFDRSLETNFFSQKMIKVFTERYSEVGISFSKIIFLTNNYTYKNLIEEEWGRFKLKVLYFPYFLFLSHILSREVDSRFFNLEENINENTTRDLFIPIRYSRFPRLKLLIELNKLGMLENSEWSLSSTNLHKLSSEIKEDPEFLNFLSQYNLDSTDNFFKIIKGLSFNYLKNNTDHPVTKSFFYHANSSFKDFNVIDNIQFFSLIPDYNVWSDYKVYVVCESHVSGKYQWFNDPSKEKVTSIHLTEKTFKPIRLNKPFVILGEKNSLKVLQEFGFKTFNTLISEKYDSVDLDYPFKEVNHNTPELDFKLKEVIDSCRILMDKYKTDETKEICNFNFYHIRNTEYFYYIFKKHFINNLDELHRTSTAN